MFTGIVQAIGQIKAQQRQTAGVRLVVDRMGWRPAGATIDLGCSICVSGVCLTVAEFDDQVLQFDVMSETLSRSTLAGSAPGSKVNIEPALTAQTPLGGHFVQGHVDGIGTVSRVQTTPDDWRVTIEPPAELLECIVPKGSIAVDGVSLTVATVDAKAFEVALIPTTLQTTTLGRVDQGTQLNLETDIISKTIVHWLRAQAGGDTSGQTSSVTMATLYRAGIT